MQSNHHDSSRAAEDTDLTSPANLRKLVLNYLLHNCYIDTAMAFAKDGIIDDLSSHASLTSSPANSIPKSKSTFNSQSGSPSHGDNSHNNNHGNNHNNGSSNGRQAHPLAAPPLSREDSSMEIEVENVQRPSSSNHPASHTDASAMDEDTVTSINFESNGRSNGANGVFKSDQDHNEDETSDSHSDLLPQHIENTRARKQIREHIIQGRIRQAIDVCNTYFPTVLSGNPFANVKSSLSSASDSVAKGKAQAQLDGANRTSASSSLSNRVLPANPTSLDPAHLLLNLQIQVFIESIRSASSSQLSSSTSSLPPPSSSQLGGSSSSHLSSLAAISRSASPAPSSASSNGSGTSTTGGGPASTLNPALHSALAYAQGLYTSAQKLPSYWRAMYLKELEQVTALLAYTDVEHSPVRKFLHKSRKVALAEQVNSAILYRSGKPSQPLIESAVRQTTFVWSHLYQDKVVVPHGHPVYSLIHTPGAARYEEQESKKNDNGKVMPPWDFKTFLAER